MSVKTEQPNSSTTDDLESRFTEAFMEATRQQVRDHAAKLDLHPQRITDVLETARRESDRSAAILIFALAEDLMLDAVKRYCNSDVSGGWEELVGGNGLLATANDRITFLHLLYWIQPTTYKNLRLLKSIRNRFAHHPEVANCEDGKIRSWIAALDTTWLRDNPLEKPAQESDPALSTRQIFLIRAAIVITRLVDNLAIGPHSRAHMLNPKDIEIRDFDKLSENRKSNVLIAVNHIIAVRKEASGQG